MSIKLGVEARSMLNQNLLEPLLEQQCSVLGSDCNSPLADTDLGRHADRQFAIGYGFDRVD